MGAGLIDDFILSILFIPFCPYHFVRYHFVLEPPMSLKIYITVLKRKTSLDVILKNKTPSSFSVLITARAEINSTRALPVIARAWLRHWLHTIPYVQRLAGSNPIRVST